MISIVILFFRVPVALFVWVSYGALLFYGNQSTIKQAFLIVAGAIIIVFALGSVTYSMERYVGQGGVTETYRFVNYTSFQRYVSYVATLVGPFPDLLQTRAELSFKSMFGAGLLYKFLLFFPFWKGVKLCVAEREKLLFPIYTFVFLEMAGIIVVLDGLELRKSLAHMPFFIMAAFWYMSRHDEDMNEQLTHTPYYIWASREFIICAFIVFGTSLFWNILR